VSVTLQVTILLIGTRFARTDPSTQVGLRQSDRRWQTVSAPSFHLTAGAARIEIRRGGQVEDDEELQR
jgi:hypothetical protein